MIKKIIFKIKLYFVGPFNAGILFQDYLGVKIGKNSRFTGKDVSFGSEPYLIEIGDDVTITQKVVFHTHDGGVGVLRKKFPGINVFGKIKVGNNVFIGSNTIILPGVTIGNNVVIGAGSVVTKNVASNSVVAGVPAKFIKSIEEYEEASLKKAVYLDDLHGKARVDAIKMKMDT